MENRVKQYDIAVIGAGPGGLTAAVTAARLGAKVLLVDRSGFLGGNLASGLPLLAFLDRKGRQVSGGFAQELIDRLTELGGCYGHARCPMHNSVTVVHPELMKLVAIEKVREAGVDVLLHCELCDTEVAGGALRRVILVGKGTKYIIEAKIFIDGTGDGDVGYSAGAEYEKGMENTGVLQPPTVLFTLGGVDQPKFFDYLEAHPEELSAPDTMQVDSGYNAEFFRRTKSRVVLGMKPLLDRLKKMGECPVDRDTLIFINSANPDSVVVNSTRLLGVDGSDAEDLTRGELTGQEQILKLIQVVKKHLPGFENCYLTAIAPSIGVRESRRLMGVKKLTIDKVLAGDIPPDTIALGSYKVDIHSGTGEGTRLEVLEEPYGIPYGCLIAKDIEGLMMAGRCISMDSPTLGTARVMPTCMGVGQAAGVAAALSVRQSKSPKILDVKEIRSILLKQGAILKVTSES